MKSGPLPVIVLAPPAGAVAGLLWWLSPWTVGRAPDHAGIGWFALLGILFALACAPQVALMDQFLARRPDGSGLPSTARPLALGATGLTSGFLLPLVLWLPAAVAGMWRGSPREGVVLALLSGTAGVCVALAAATLRPVDAVRAASVPVLGPPGPSAGPARRGTVRP
jgi:hypothetical protein